MWNSRELLALKELFPVATTQQLCAIFPGKSYVAIRTRARRLGLRRGRVKRVASTVHPVIAETAALLHESTLTLSSVCEAAGLHPDTATAWFTGNRSPTLQAVSDVLEELGYRLTIEPGDAERHVQRKAISHTKLIRNHIEELGAREQSRVSDASVVS